MIEIFGPSVSPFVVKVLVAADYKKLDYRHQSEVSISELAKLNSVTGKVPVVRIDGEVIYDSTRILESFDALESRFSLLSKDKLISSRQRMLEDWSDESLYWYVQALRWSEPNRKRTIKQNSRFVPFLVRPFAPFLLNNLVGKQPKAQGLGRLPYSFLLDELDKRLEDLECHLGGSTFFFSSTPSAADFSIAGVFSTALLEQVTPDFQALVIERKALVDWYARMRLISKHLVGDVQGSG